MNECVGFMEFSFYKPASSCTVKTMTRERYVRSVTAFTFKPLISPLQVNIIPIIAKSDAISKSELAKFKLKITSELVSNGVQIYQFPTDDESVAEINSTMNVSGSISQTQPWILVHFKLP